MLCLSRFPVVTTEMDPVQHYDMCVEVLAFSLCHGFLALFVLVSVGLVWESAKSGGQHIRDVVNYCIGTSLDLAEVGRIVNCSCLFNSRGKQSHRLSRLHKLTTAKLPC